MYESIHTNIKSLQNFKKMIYEQEKVCMLIFSLEIPKGVLEDHFEALKKYGEVFSPIPKYYIRVLILKTARLKNIRPLTRQHVTKYKTIPLHKCFMGFSTKG